MFDITGTLVGLLLAVAVAGFFSGITGFGFNLLATPVLLLAYPSHTAVQIALILGFGVSLVLLLSPGVAKEIDRHLLGLLTIWGVIGAPMGAILFVRVDPHVLKAAIGIVVVAYAIVAVLARNVHWVRHRHLGRSAGLLSGALAASTGLSGPPIVMYIHAHRPTGRYFRANVAAYVAILSVVSLATHAVIGEISLAAIGDFTVLMPASLLGMLLGTTAFAKIPHRIFDSLVLGILAIVGIGTLASAIA